MKHRFSFSLVCAALAAALLFGLFGDGQTVNAQVGECPAIASLQPGAITNATESTLLITGTGFDGVELVVLRGYSSLAIDADRTDTKLRVTVPAGVPASPGGTNYAVEVVEPGCDTAEATLRVSSPPQPTEVLPTEFPSPTPTPMPTAYVRPVLTVQSYGASSPTLVPGTDIDFEMTLQNSGHQLASNVVVTFVAGDLIPRLTGGVRALGELPPGGTNRFFQPFTVSSGVSSTVATLQVQVSYTDPYGTSYENTFELTFPAAPRSSGAAPTATPTPTPVGQTLQLAVTDYRTSVEHLQPGSVFSLEFDIANLGTGDASNVAMVIGGGEISQVDGTPAPGGVSGGSGDFDTFAPLGRSNVQFIEAIPAGEVVTASQDLVVNVSTEPGAYPLKVTFIYSNEAGQRFKDDQVITLLVYGPPKVEASFYRDPGPLFVGQPSMLPIQITNLGRSGAVLGNLEVTSDAGEVTNGVVLIGLIEAGNYFTADATLFAEQPGPAEINVTIHYVDDFNQPQTITQTLTVQIEEAPPEIIGEPDMPIEPMPEPETFLQKVWRFVRGLLGLDSSRNTSGGNMMPGGEVFPGGNAMPVPMP
ncbi:MAG TPA: hypothetical protein PK801_00975 [Aggregatilineales bacterium]|nr:hypothetical protein [Aggregatilineales bacterium]HQE17482.1 hypothetical protein [Aggregatilineales bacterium]